MPTPEGHNDLKPLMRIKLQQADRPLTCYDLAQDPDIQALGAPMNRISDYLGVMFRNGEVKRLPVERGESKARWGYVWREKVTPEWKQQNADKELRDFKPKPVFDRPNLYISDNGSYLSIEMPEISIQIQIRKTAQAPAPKPSPESTGE